MIPLIGFAAAIIGALAFLPQVIKTYRTRSSTDLSAWMLIAMTTAATLWVIYGASINSAPVMFGNSVTLGMSVSLLALKLRFD